MQAPRWSIAGMWGGAGGEQKSKAGGGGNYDGKYLQRMVGVACVMFALLIIIGGGVVGEALRKRNEMHKDLKVTTTPKGKGKAWASLYSKDDKDEKNRTEADIESVLDDLHKEENDRPHCPAVREGEGCLRTKKLPLWGTPFDHNGWLTMSSADKICGKKHGFGSMPKDLIKALPPQEFYGRAPQPALIGRHRMTECA